MGWMDGRSFNLGCDFSYPFATQNSQPVPFFPLSFSLHHSVAEEYFVLIYFSPLIEVI
jgi:hypothetical protein